jgi:hypothetical protein
LGPAPVVVLSAALFGARLVLRTTLLFLATLLLSATLILRAALLLRAALRCRGLIAFLLREALALRGRCRRFGLRVAAGRSAHRTAWIAHRAAWSTHLMLLDALGLHCAALWAGVLRYSK